MDSVLFSISPLVADLVFDPRTAMGCMEAILIVPTPSLWKPICVRAAWSTVKLVKPIRFNN